MLVAVPVMHAHGEHAAHYVVYFSHSQLPSVTQT